MASTSEAMREGSKVFDGPAAEPSRAVQRNARSRRAEALMAAISTFGVQLLFASVVLGGHLHRAGMHAGRCRSQAVSRSRKHTHRLPTPVGCVQLRFHVACMQSSSMETRMPSPLVAGACMLAPAGLRAPVTRQAARCRPTWRVAAACRPGPCCPACVRKPAICVPQCRRTLVLVPRVQADSEAAPRGGRPRRSRNPSAAPRPVRPCVRPVCLCACFFWGGRVESAPSKRSKMADKKK